MMDLSPACLLAAFLHYSTLPQSGTFQLIIHNNPLIDAVCDTLHIIYEYDKIANKYDINIKSRRDTDTTTDCFLQQAESIE